MPDKRTHRGPHGQDAELFGPTALPVLRTAVGHVSWLLSHDYSEKASLTLVADRFALKQRQRLAVMRAACSDADRARRRESEVLFAQAGGQPLAIDGYNLLTTIEAALGGAVILHARDGCFRDIASMHGTYRKVSETLPALDLIADVLAAGGFPAVHWFLDRPVSNSGRLKEIIDDLAERRRFPWQVTLTYSPDHILAESSDLVVSADSQIINRAGRWLNLACHIVTDHIPSAFLIDLTD